LNQFSGQVAPVSNGSRGSGAAIVRMLAGSGWVVTFCHDRDDQAVQVEKDASALGVRVLAGQADVTWPTEAAAGPTRSRSGRQNPDGAPGRRLRTSARSRKPRSVRENQLSHYERPMAVRRR
jgi:NAD(P)-dependent dehydrogenase (short-subunit alcohol dehydrogenase family)